MDREKMNIDEVLLDWHLNRLDPESRVELEAALHEDDALRKRNDHVGRLLRPLDHASPHVATSTLADRVMLFVETLSKSAATTPAPSTSGRVLRFPVPGLRWRDAIGAAASIGVVMGLLVPGVAAMRARAQQTACGANLASIFRGASSYQQAYAGALPFAGCPTNTSWLPTTGQEPKFASNSRHVYRLLKDDFGVKPNDFVCPSVAQGSPMPTRALAAHDDFAEARNISYDSINFAAASPRLIRPAAPIAYLGDRNPLFVDAKFNADVDADHANSPAHRRRGQMVLATDGSASWLTSPIFGSNSDNLWLIGNIRRYTGTESPTSPDDVQLIPGFPQVSRSTTAN